MRINTNVAALNSYNQLKQTNDAQSKSLERLSSGLRINRASDDAAGLAISEKMTSQTKGLSQAQRNAQDGISMIQTAEGALKETHSILQRTRELAVQASNDSNTEGDRIEIQEEIDQLTSEIDRIAKNTEFNTKELLNGDQANTLRETAAEVGGDTTGAIALDDETEYSTGSYTVVGSGNSEVNATGSYGVFADGDSGNIEILTAGSSIEIDNITISGDAVTTGAITISGSGYGATGGTDNSLTFHIGANEEQNTQLGINSMLSTDLGVDGIDVTTQSGADAAIATVDDAITDVSSERSKLGAKQNRLEHTINNLSTSEENLKAANSRIKDVDMAAEMMNMSKQRILSQAGTAMLAQANQKSQGVLQLLG